MFPLLLLITTLVPTGHVSDFAQLLRPETVSSLEISLSSLEKETGTEIAVVTIDSHGTDETIETYAEKLFQKWGIGKAKEDNGLLLLISRDDREMRIEVGYGLEPIITDIESSRIIREILTPAFQNGEYDAGVISAVNRMVEGVRNGAPLETPIDTPVHWEDIFPVALFFLIFLSSVLARSKSWWAGGVIGGLAGWFFFGGIIFILGLIFVGLLFDYIVSKTYKNSVARGVLPPWWIGGGHGGGGGFGGFGGGMSGGGGASGKW